MSRGATRFTLPGLSRGATRFALPGPSRGAIGVALLGLLLAGCQTPRAGSPPGALSAAEAVEAWEQRTEARRALRALARLSVDAPGAAPDGGDLQLRARQRLWIARPARMRVEVLGLLDSALAVLTIDRGRYALLQAPGRQVERGEVYPELLWEVARLELSPEETVGLILGAPALDSRFALAGAARRGDTLRLRFADAAGRLRRVADLGAAGELRRLEQRDAEGALAWEAHYADFVELGGDAFAQELRLRSPDAEARVLLRRVELNPALPEGLFEVAP